MKKVILLCLWLGVYTGIVNAITSFPPSATTNAATNININDATLNGKVQANTPSVSAIYFDYGISTSYGASILATPSTLPGDNTSNITAILSGLKSNTTYNYRVRAINISGEIGYGSNMTFKTPAAPTTLSVTSTEGGLSAAIVAAGGELSSVTNITVTGIIDATDFKAMRDNMLELAILDISEVTIKAYTGASGTGGASSITYPENEVPQYAFSNRSTRNGKNSLTSIKLPKSITSIGQDAFLYCQNLTGSLTIPPLVTTIRSEAFEGCKGLTGPLTIPSSVITIGDNAFTYCSGLTGSLIIPNGVKFIESAAFHYCNGLTGVLNIPNTVTTIGSYAFQGCKGFSSLTFEANSQLRIIPASCFSNCSGLTSSVTIPSSINSLQDYAFEGCSKLNGSITIPSSVTSIGSYAFMDCITLTSINILAITPVNLTNSANVFNNINKVNCKLTVPTDSYSAYAKATQWKDFFSITTPSPATLSGYSTTQGTVSSSKTFIVGVSATMLDLTITAPTGYEVRENNIGTFSSSLTFTSATGNISNKTIEVRIKADATVGTPSGNVVCSSNGATSKNVAASGTVSSPPPTITAISPKTGPTTGGTSVTITGTNLTGATVKFGSIDATNATVKSATEITATAPARTAGKVDITVTTAGGTSAISSTDEFTYITPATLTVTGNLRPFMHCAGSISEEQSFTVSGSDLSSDITINSLMGFEYSTTSGSDFKPSLTLPKNGTSVATTRVYVRAEAYAANVATGNIGISTSGATTQSLAVGAYTGGASYTTSGSTFNIRLGCSTTVSVASTATGYTFTLNNGSWYGTGASVNGTTLTVTNLSDYDTFKIEDEAAGTSVTFANSGTNAYNDNFNLTLNNLAGVVTFNGTSSFSGSNAISINTDKNTVFATGSKLSAVDGNITLSANMQTTSSTFSGSGVFVNNAVIETTGTGAVSIKGRAGNGSSEYNGFGVTLQNGAKINGSSINVEGHGSSNASSQFNMGVLITASTITCGNGDLTLKGNGGGLNSAFNHGISIDRTSKVTSLGTGSVILNGIGGNNAGSAGNDNNGVVIWGSEVSTGGGDLIINGTGGGGGNASASNYNCGVVINQAAVAKTKGNGKVSVTGNGGNNSANNTGVNNFGVLVVNTSSKITSSNGNVEVTGNGGGNGGSGTSNFGIYVSNNGMITSEGTTSTVNVTGTGGNGSGNTNYGVNVDGIYTQNYFGVITSNGGDITVTGYGGGSGSSKENYGVYASYGGKIKAGNTGAVTVTGIGGNSSGNYNLGIYINSYATIPNYSMISSTGGSVVVNGTGGGNGASASNYGVYATNGGRIVAENNGTVRVIGTGGNNTNAANSSDNMGIKLQNLDTQISSHNGNIELIGNGGNRNGSGSYNYGFYLYDGAKVSSTGTTSSISIEGVGGSSTGTLNDGVTLNSVYYPASITSNGGNIFLTGTEGNSVCKAINFTGYGSSVSTLTNGGNITLKGNSMNIGVAGAIKVHENNSLSILPKTAGTAFELGTTSDDVSGGPIRISATEFSYLSAETINIGDLNTGNITINQGFTTYSNLNLITAEGASVIPIATATDVSMVGKNLTIASGTVLKIAIGGATANTNYDQLKTTGNINLAGVDLVLEGSYIPVTGNSFTIVSGASIAGTFNGLADGAYISFNKKLLRINYTSSAVTLTFVPFTISSPTATAIKLTTATLGATIAPANAPVLERGICWSKTAGVTIDNNKTSEGGTTGGTFTVNVSDIRNSTTIYYKGYVVTPDNETILSDEANFSNVPVFTGTGDWKDAERWNVKEVPFDPRSTPVIAGNCTISQAPVDGLEFYDLTINSGAKLTLNADQTLLTNTFTNNAGVSGLVIKASSTLPNATFAYNIGTPSATVEMYSKASWNLEIAKGDRFNWQYFGIPVKTLAYSPVFDNSIVRRYNESATDDASLWKMETADSTLTSGTGYELTQEAAKLYSFKGELRTGDFEAKLPYSIGAQYPGQHIFGNPFTTAVNISQIDYGLNTEQSVYLFNTGTYNNWKEDATSLGNKAGQYTVSTKLTAGVAGIPAQIPSMQGFLMKTTGTNPGSFTFGYYTGGLYINKEMQRAPRTNATDEKVITRIDVTSKQSADRMWIFTEPTCTRNFDNGWDGYKMMGSVVNPQLFAMEADGNYQINAVPTINETYLGFQAGQDTDYTLKFTQLNVASTYNKLYLMDLVDGHIVDITADGSEYSFKASSTPQAVKRFKIVADVDNSTGNTEIVNNNLKISHSNETIYIENRSDQRGTCTIYDLKGVAIKINLFDAQKVSLISTRGLIPGVYLIKAGNGIVQVTEKIIIR